MPMSISGSPDRTDYCEPQVARITRGRWQACRAGFSISGRGAVVVCCLNATEEILIAEEYSFALVLYDDYVGAQSVFSILQKLQKEQAIDIKEAAVVTRGASGKIAVDNLGFVGTGKGGVLGLVIGAVAVSAPLAGLLVGGLIGFGRSGDRRRLTEVLDKELGVRQSALAIVIKEADWAAVAEATKGWSGEIIKSSLSEEALVTLEGLSAEEDVTAAKGEALEGG